RLAQRLRWRKPLAHNVLVQDNHPTAQSRLATPERSQRCKHKQINYLWLFSKETVSGFNRHERPVSRWQDIKQPLLHADGYLGDDVDRFAHLGVNGHGSACAQG